MLSFHNVTTFGSHCKTPALHIRHGEPPSVPMHLRNDTQHGPHCMLLRSPSIRRPLSAELT